MSKNRVWFITGCSTGFGRVLCEEVLANGERVVATARKSEVLADLAAKYPDTCLVTKLDVTNQADASAAVDLAVAKFGQIDVLVNNAGYGMLGAVEEVSDAEAKALFEVNVFGVLNVNRAVLPVMRKQRSGRVLNISSVVGRVGFIGSAMYCATKHALEALTEGIRGELEPLGIKVSSIEPGPFRTDFAGRSISMAANQISDYADTAGAGRVRIKEMHGTQIGDPLLAVRAMIAVVDAENPPLCLPLGAMACDVIREKLNDLLKEQDEWEHVGRPTDFPVEVGV